ncbi:hypothetical protein D3C76_1128380 [compost metagenome]
MLGQQGLALAHAHRRYSAIEVFPHRSGELRLAAVGLDDAHVWRHAGEGAIEGGGSDARLQGLLTKAGLPFTEGLGGLYQGSGIDRNAGRRRHYGRRGGCQRHGIGSRRLFGTGNQADEARGSDQWAHLPTMGKT